MKILLIAPQPFFQERGTPIAVKLLAETLTEVGHTIDLLTYPEGEDISLPNLRIIRIPAFSWIKNIPIGFSWKKLVCDGLLSIYMIPLLFRNQYEVIHAVEESIFPALVLNFFVKKKLIYDMDSSLVDQLLEKWESLNFLKPLLDFWENLAFKSAHLVLPVCKSLADKVISYDPYKTVITLEDVAFEPNEQSEEVENLREQFNINSVLSLYVGNLEHYQGVDLMLEAFAKIKSGDRGQLIIIGGAKKDIIKYQLKSQELQIKSYVHFLGPRPLKQLPFYLEQADILISPRIKGVNTPMKIYSYLASGKPVLATRIGSHTQVLDDDCAVLADPSPEFFAQKWERLIKDSRLRLQIGRKGKYLAQRRFSVQAYKEKLLNAYTTLLGNHT